ncbi:MAG: hypothetical protein JST64_16090, partial [Actinobacteria bacterium]|nr:hypothetical protein [Actinomycetota bacterium]
MVVELGPIVRFVEATGGGPRLVRTDRLPISTTSLWTRPAAPGALPPAAPGAPPLALHFEVKSDLGFEHAVIVGHRTVLHQPTRIGDRIGHHQELRSVGPPRPTALGPGRMWEVDHVLTDADGAVLQVETFTALGYRPSGPAARRRPAGSDQEPRSATAVGRLGTRRIAGAATAARVWAPMHHDPAAARRAGLPCVIACTQHVVALVEWALLDAATPGATIRSLDVRLRRPITATATAPPSTTVLYGPGRGAVTVSVDQDDVTAAVA